MDRPGISSGNAQRGLFTAVLRPFLYGGLDFAYYAMPKAAQLAKMLETGGPRLTFSIKAHETLTHKINPSTWEDDARTYLEALEPLLRKKRLEAVLFQFPPQFKYEPDNRYYLDKLLTYFKALAERKLKDLTVLLPDPPAYTAMNTELERIAAVYTPDF